MAAGLHCSTPSALDPTQPIDEVWIQVAKGDDVAAGAGTIERTLTRAYGDPLALDIVVPRDRTRLRRNR